MKCERCNASYEQCYAESYDSDWECLAGVPDEDREEFKDGRLGCRLHPKTIDKRLDMILDALEKERAAYVEWYLETEEKKNDGYKQSK